MTYKVLWLDIDFHELVVIGKGLTMEQAQELKNKYSMTCIEEES